MKHLVAAIIISELSRTCFWRPKESESCSKPVYYLRDSDSSKTTPSNTPTHVGCCCVAAMFIHVRRLRTIKGISNVAMVVVQHNIIWGGSSGLWYRMPGNLVVTSPTNNGHPCSVKVRPSVEVEIAPATPCEEFSGTDTSGYQSPGCPSPTSECVC